MRVKFNDGSYIEMKLSSPGKVGIIMAASSKDNPLQIVHNVGEVSLQELANLVAGIGVPLPSANINIQREEEK